MKNQVFSLRDKTIALLPTEDASQLYLSKHNELYKLYSKGNNGSGGSNYHLYLCSNAEIKEGDWILCSMSAAPTKALKGENYISNAEWKKIEFTTDPKLIADGVPAIDGNTKAITIHFNWIDSSELGKEIRKEVNFLTEFCKRWNEKGGKETIMFDAEKPYIKKDNQEVDVEKLALKKYPISIVPTDRFEDKKEWDENKDLRQAFIAGANALKSKAGGYSLEDAINFGVNIEAGNIRRDYSITASQQFLQSLTSTQSKAGGYSFEEVLEWLDEQAGRVIEVREVRAKIQSLTSTQSKAGGYSLEDMDKAIELAIQEGMLIQRTINDKVSIPHSRSKEYRKTYLQSLTKEQPKGDMVIEVEMEQHPSDMKELDFPFKVKGNFYIPKRIKLTNGQPTLIFK